MSEAQKVPEGMILRLGLFRRASLTQREPGHTAGKSVGVTAGITMEVSLPIALAFSRKYVVKASGK